MQRSARSGSVPPCHQTPATIQTDRSKARNPRCREDPPGIPWRLNSRSRAVNGGNVHGSGESNHPPVPGSIHGSRSWREFPFSSHLLSGSPMHRGCAGVQVQLSHYLSSHLRISGEKPAFRHVDSPRMQSEQERATPLKGGSRFKEHLYDI